MQEAKTGGPDEMGEQLSVENENEGDKAGGSQEAGGQLSVQVAECVQVILVDVCVYTWTI